MRQKLSCELVGSPENDIILFLHGIGTASWCWWQQVDAFKENYSILLVDLPGHGESAHVPWENMDVTVDLVADAIPEGKKAHIIGVSLGGHVALDLAVKYPQKIQSAYISGITTKPMGPKIFKGLLPLYLRQISKLQNNETKLQDFFIQMGIPHEKIAASISEYQKVSINTMRAIFDELYLFKMDCSYSKISSSIMFVACEYEERGIQQTLSYAPTIISQAKTSFIKGARHQWPIQKPEVFNREIKKWMISVSNNK